ncbi:MAG: hypothetical protein K8R23_05810 [Chthoniobacter sp.]|nr:hypothetical protein [Chthoniobacter sp.]
MNALKHGILSEQVLVRGLGLSESTRELKALHRGFWDDLQPVGAVEEMLVDQIVTAHWRLRRALTAESGEIALSVGAGQRRRRGPGPVMQWVQWQASVDLIHAMEGSATGLALLWGWLKEVRASVVAEGVLTEGAVQKLTANLGGKTTVLTYGLEALRSKYEADPDRAEAGRRERHRAETLAFLDREISGFECDRYRCEEEESAAEARQAAAVLPSAETLEKILRYETKLERQIFRAMAQLERVQRMRRGEAIPAPLSVEVSDRG